MAFLEVETWELWEYRNFGMRLRDVLPIPFCTVDNLWGILNLQQLALQILDRV